MYHYKCTDRVEQICGRPDRRSGAVPPIGDADRNMGTKTKLNSLAANLPAILKSYIAIVFQTWQLPLSEKQKNVELGHSSLDAAGPGKCGSLITDPVT